jgi:hypothetical protein
MHEDADGVGPRHREWLAVQGLDVTGIRDVLGTTVSWPMSGRPLQFSVMWAASACRA